VAGFAAVSQVREYPALSEKRGRKVSAVLPCVILRRGRPEAPVWLFCSSAPDAETEKLCERVFRSKEGLALLIEAQMRWPLKLAPFSDSSFSRSDDE
jgi:hypothetical protein